MGIVQYDTFHNLLFLAHICSTGMSFWEKNIGQYISSATCQPRFWSSFECH